MAEGGNGSTKLKRQNGLTGTQVKQLQEMLLAKKRKLEGSLIRPEAVENRFSDLMDTAAEQEALDRESALKRQKENELLQIKQALAQMENGTYGECPDCEEQIPFKRLAAMPTAHLCIECQTKREKAVKVPGKWSRSRVMQPA